MAKGDETVIRWNYHQNDVIFLKSFTSNKGSRLIGIMLNPKLNKCDGPLGREWSSFWFVIQADNSVVPLLPRLKNPDSQYQLVPIDFGDYDGEGKSEALFWVSAYNEDGYVMFYDAFSKHVSFTWFYH